MVRDTGNRCGYLSDIVGDDMIVGYLSEDGKIYDKNGRFVKMYGLDNDEKIVEEDKQFYCKGIMPGWTGTCKGGSLGPGKGVLTITNKHLIFRRSIRPVEKFYNQPFLPLSIWELIKAKKLKNRNLKEYFQLPFDEIKSYNKSLFGAYIYTQRKKKNTY